MLIKYLRAYANIINLNRNDIACFYNFYQLLYQWNFKGIFFYNKQALKAIYLWSINQ